VTKQHRVRVSLQRFDVLVERLRLPTSQFIEITTDEAQI